MTSQPQPSPGDGRTVGQLLRPLRDIAAWALVAAPAVLLFVAVIRLIPSSDGENFGSRTQDSFYGFVNLATILFPLAAVLLALLVQPHHPKARLITMIALIEYAATAFFGVLFGFLIGLINVAGFRVRLAFEEFLARTAWLAVFAVAAWALYTVWRSLYFVPKPKKQPGMYGQPQYGAPGTYPGQPGYGPPPGQPAWNQQQPVQGYPPQAPPPGWGHHAPTVPQPGTYGAPSHALSEPTQVVPPASAPPMSVPPMSVPPASAPPASAPPASVPPMSAPPAAPDATRMLPEDRPGFGPADHDPPRS